MNRIITTYEGHLHVVNNIKNELKRLYDTNRTLLDLDSDVAYQQIQLNWSKMRELENRLKDWLDPTKTKVCPPAQYHPIQRDTVLYLLTRENKMNKFNTKQSPEDTTAAAIYEMQEEFRKEEESKDIPIHEQFGCTVEEWNHTCDVWDARHDMYGLHGMQAVPPYPARYRIVSIDE